MKPIRFLSLSICLAVGLGFLLVVQAAPPKIKSLTCEYQENPLGIDTKQPRLSWMMDSDERGQMQMAYRILVASTLDKLEEGKADLWDSGKILSDQSAHLVYQGKPLISRQRSYWKVKIWVKDGESSEYSEPAFWEMALLSPSEWQARWLRHPDFLDTLYEAKPAPMFRKEFSINKPIKEARAYVTGLGYYVMYLNGERVGDHILDPVKTRYDKTVKYVTYDITATVSEGSNAIGLILGTGWYNHFAQAAWGFNKAPWRNYPTMLCQVEIMYEDGSRQIIASDHTWKTATGPVLFDGIRNGETYDARLEISGWNEVGFDESGWQKAVEADGPEGKLSPQMLPPIKEMQEITPVSIQEVKPGVYVFDLGQNMAGYCRLQIAGPAGTEVKLKHGEKLNEDGTVEQKQILRFLKTGKAQTDRYILKGEGIETWQPYFVYHGFQYVEVTGLPVKPTKETLTGIVIYTSFEKAGGFACSNPLLNQLQQNTLWSYIGNYHGIPTDCPHREKIGWTGDGHLVAEAGLYNFNVVTSYIKWLDDFVDEQQESGDLPGVIPTSGWGYTYGRDESKRHLGYGPQWEGAFVLIPWYLYQYTGDTSIIARYYAPIKKYIDFLAQNANNYTLDFGIDDHKPVHTHTEGDILASGYFFKFSQLFSQVATLLGKEKDAAQYAKLAEKAREAFNEKYYRPEEGIYGNGGQTSLSEALFHGLVPAQEQEKVLRNLIANIENQYMHFDAGVVGVKYLLNTLTEAGRADIVYQLVNQRDFPSLGYWVEQEATTLWQDWDGSMSLNHIMFGSVSEWFFKALAGINVDPEQPGFKNVIIKPFIIDDLTWSNGEHTSMYGTIKSSWEKKDGQLRLRLTIPANTTATVYLPTSNPESIKEEDIVVQSAQGVEFVRYENGRAIMEIGSGSYTFIAPL